MLFSSARECVRVSISTDRKRSASLLLRVEKGAYASRLLARVSEAGIRTRVMAVLRWRRTLDAALNNCLKTPLRKLDTEVRTVLRLSLAEVVLIGVPAPVAGDGAVHLVREMGKGRASGLVNAVMRRAPAAWKHLLDSAPPDLKFSHPEWLWKRWRGYFGQEAGEKIMEVAQTPAAPWAWALEDLEFSAEMRRHSWMPEAFTEAGNRLIPMLQSGRAYAMDPSSQLVAHLAVCCMGDRGRLLDLCSAPGGKAAHILSRTSECRVTASDLSLKRLRLGQRLMRQSDRLQFLAADATSPPFDEPDFDLVLLDAPCSGSGTFRRHPELKWKLEATDIMERATLQKSMIQSAVSLVKPGGFLLYSTCSIEPEENEGHFRPCPSGFSIESAEEYLPTGTPWIPTEVGGYRLLPGEEWDGFSIHLVKRIL